MLRKYIPNYYIHHGTYVLSKSKFEFLPSKFFCKISNLVYQ